MVQEPVVCNLEEPGFELAVVRVSVYGELCLHQGFLRYIIGVGHISGTQSQQKASEGILLSLYL